MAKSGPSNTLTLPSRGTWAGKAAASLRQSVSVQARVIRDGKPIAVAVTDVVPGDLVVLSAGDMIPADGRVIEANDFFVKQALLTGEPYPVEKRPGQLAAGAVLFHPRRHGPGLSRGR